MLHSRNHIGSSVELTKAQMSWRDWRQKFIVVSGMGWESFGEETCGRMIRYPIHRR